MWRIRFYILKIAVIHFLPLIPASILLAVRLIFLSKFLFQLYWNVAISLAICSHCMVVPRRLLMDILCDPFTRFMLATFKAFDDMVSALLAPCFISSLLSSSNEHRSVIATFFLILLRRTRHSSGWIICPYGFFVFRLDCLGNQVVHVLSDHDCLGMCSAWSYF